MIETFRYVLYAVLFFGVFISASLFLNSRENSSSMRIVVLMKNMHGHPIIERIDKSSTSENCVTKLMNDLQSGSIDFREVGKQLDKCLMPGLTDLGNNTGINPGLHSENENIPRFI